MTKNPVRFWLLMIACCVLTSLEAKAQNTYGYSSISDDPNSNTVTAYAQTYPDYNTQTYYYNAYVQANIHDANGNVIAHQTSVAGNPSVSFSISGNGSSSYDIASGHYLLLYYSQANVYSSCNTQYYSFGYYDYYNYQNFVEYPSPNATYPLYQFFGPGPVCYYSSPDIILGQSKDTATAACVKPGGETSTSVGWDDSNNMPTVLLWKATLTPSTTIFTGRSVTEGAGSQNIDTCWYAGSPVSYAHVTGGTWAVDANNQYGIASPGPDLVGFTPAAVTWYRQHNRAPCGYNVEQKMSIDCPDGGSALYQDNLQTYDITSTQVSCARGTAAKVTRTWP